jgi:hypothetical protein
VGLPSIDPAKPLRESKNSLGGFADFSLLIHNCVARWESITPGMNTSNHTPSSTFEYIGNLL